jgi:BCD family chlorophyll transporter-like MFS transporter
MGFNFATVSYLSLATELSSESDRGRTIAIMWFMMIVGIIFTSILLSRLLDPYSPGALVRSFWMVGLAALLLGTLGLIKLERRSTGADRSAAGEERYTWGVLFRAILENPQAAFFFVYLAILLTALLGQDILLEPYAGEAFNMPVTQTTRITAIWGLFTLVALLVAGWLERRLRSRQVAAWGGWGALAGFVLIALSGLVRQPGIFYAGLVLLGFGTGLSTVANLSLMLDMTVVGKVGLFIGAWGMSNAVSRLFGSVIGGALRDVLSRLLSSPVLAYVGVFTLLAALMLVSLLMLRRVDVVAFREQTEQIPIAERAALAGDA